MVCRHAACVAAKRLTTTLWQMSEAFLQRMMSLYVSSHYKNSPNDLQLMSDAPAHRLFVLLGPVDPSSGAELPDVLCVIQVGTLPVVVVAGMYHTLWVLTIATRCAVGCSLSVVGQVALEGHINEDIMREAMRRGKSSPGDLIPWTIAQQFQDEEFGGLSGARVVRIATHPSATSMGYGRKAMELLARYYQVCLRTTATCVALHSDVTEFCVCACVCVWTYLSAG